MILDTTVQGFAWSKTKDENHGVPSTAPTSAGNPSAMLLSAEGDLLIKDDYGVDCNMNREESHAGKTEGHAPPP